MRIGQTKEEKQLQMKEKKESIRSLRNLEGIRGFAANVMYKSADTHAIVICTLNTLASRYDVYFDYECFEKEFTVAMNEQLLYKGTFEEMEKLMQKGVKSSYQKFWNELIMKKL